MFLFLFNRFLFLLATYHEFNSCKVETQDILASSNKTIGMIIISKVEVEVPNLMWPCKIAKHHAFLHVEKTLYTYCVSWHISFGSSVILLLVTSRCVKECKLHTWRGRVAKAFWRNFNTRIVKGLDACWDNAAPMEALPPPDRSRMLGGWVLCVPWKEEKKGENMKIFIIILGE